MDIAVTLNEILVKLFRQIMVIEEQELKNGEFKDLSTNDMHVIEAIGNIMAKNMSTVAKSLNVTTGTLTISVNGLVKKGYVVRERSEEDRRVVLVSLTEKGKSAFTSHELFHQKMVQGVISKLSIEEQKVLQQALINISDFFQNIKNKI